MELTITGASKLQVQRGLLLALADAPGYLGSTCGWCLAADPARLRCVAELLAYRWLASAWRGPILVLGLTPAGLEVAGALRHLAGRAVGGS